MRQLLFFLLLTPFAMHSQEQITFKEDEEIIPEFAYNYHYISESKNEYLFRKARKDYYVEKIEGNELKFQAEFSALRETYNCLCDDVRD